MSAWKKCRKTFGEKLAIYLRDNPEEMDVTFSVGPTKEKIGGLKIALKAASPKMATLFKEKWDAPFGHSRLAKEIPLPEIDPRAFQIFLDLLISDNWCTEDVACMKLPPETHLNLVTATKLFGTAEMEGKLDSLTNTILIKLYSVTDSDDFLNLSRTNLETVLSSDRIPFKEIVVFESALKWAEYNCSKQRLERTGPNLRKVLGSALFQIRFPIMNVMEFADIVIRTRSKGILTEGEQLEIFKFMGLNQKKEKEKESQLCTSSPKELSCLSFNTRKRTQGKLKLTIESGLKPMERFSSIDGT